MPKVSGSRMASPAEGPIPGKGPDDRPGQRSQKTEEQVDGRDGDVKAHHQLLQCFHFSTPQ